SSGAAYDQRNPVLHAREYVARVVHKFVNNDEFHRLLSNIHSFQEREGRASEDLSALAQACDRLDIETEALRTAASRDSVGSSPSLTTFMDCLIRVELLADKLSSLTAELLPDLRSISAVAEPEGLIDTPMFGLGQVVSTSESTDMALVEEVRR